MPTMALSIETTHAELVIRLADREVRIRWEHCSLILANATAEQRRPGRAIARRLRHPLAAAG